MGGMGKTQTALQYAFMHRLDGDAIFWVRAETAHGLLTTYAAITKKLALPGTQSRIDNGRASEMARDWLERTRRWTIESLTQLLIEPGQEVATDLRQR